MRKDSPTAAAKTQTPLAALDGQGPLWQQVRRVLAEPIRMGAWPPGTRLPTEVAIKERYRTSRMTVNRAIQSLAEEGLVERRRKAGTIVTRGAQERPVFEIWDIADVVARLGGVYSHRLLECEKVLDNPQRREWLGVSRRTSVLWMLCLHSCDGEPFQLEERLVNVDAAPGITCRPLEEGGHGPWLSAYVRWTDAEHRISACEATGKIATHLKAKQGAACLVIERRTWNETTPVTFARFWQANNRVSLIGHYEPDR